MPRHAAFLCLRNHPDKPLDAVDEEARVRGLDERDTGLCRKLVGLEVRRRATLRAIVAGFAHRQPKRDLALMLRLGIAQILWLDRVPRHAAVSETVGATSELVGLSKGSVVNGVLRNLIRALKPDHSGDPTVDVPGAPFHFDAPVFRDPAEHPHLWAEDALSVPSALHKKWTQRAGMDEANRLARMAYDEAPLSLRARDAAERDERLEELRALGVDAVPGAHPALILCPAESAGVAIRSEAFAAGALTAQGEHAARAVELVGDVSGARVLDVCAAPGGKTTYLLQRGAAGVVSVDASAGRLARLEAGLARVGLGGRGRAAAMDATAALRPDARFDAVLVDAPCSNTGVLAQRPAARWRYGPKSQSALVAIQERLLESAAERVAPGGALVYSTCSLEPEENEQRVARFLERSGEFVEESRVRSAPRPPAEGGPVDGGFAARLVRTSG